MRAIQHASTEARRAVFAIALVSLAIASACSASSDAEPRGAGTGGGPIVDESPVVLASKPPPPIGAGTLILAADGFTAVASDPDRDTVWWTRVEHEAEPVQSLAFAPGDEPGRLVQDAAGLVHVVLRGAGAVAAIDLASASVVRTSQVCAAPRGIAYDPNLDQLIVTCVGGELVSLAAADDSVERTLQLQQDLRDVVVLDDGFLVVSTFRRAEIMLVDPAGAVRSSTRPYVSGGFVFGREPCVAWRMVKVPTADAVVVTYQLGSMASFDVAVPNSYASQGSAVTSALAFLLFDLTAPDPAPGVQAGSFGGALPVDVAVSADGSEVAVALYGSQQAGFVSSTATNHDFALFDVWSASLAVDPSGRVVAFVREPASFLVQPTDTTPPFTAPIDAPSVSDTGHTLFHVASQANGSIACASCHPEGRDDGRVWSFAGMGQRRTPSLVGGLLATAPFHWDGDLPTVDSVVAEVFTKRMGGPIEDAPHVAALSRFLEAIPRVPLSTERRWASVALGQRLFESAEVGCTNCHNGPHLTNDATVDVGTGQAFQVPTLVGVGLRAPFLHDGCALTLADRFGPCGGGDRHGHTSQLSPYEVDALVAFLGTL